MPLDELLLIVGTFAAGTWLLRPVMLALAERLRGSRLADGGAAHQVEALREELLGELQQTRREVAELGERLDFAERLLAQQKAPERLDAGGR